MYETFQEQEVNLAINMLRGMDLKTPNYLLPPGGADICQNWRFNENGHLSRRPSFAKYNATSLGANPITYSERIYIGANKYLLAAYDTTLKVGDDAAGTFTNLKTALTAGLHYGTATYKNFHYLGNGTDANIKTDGTAANTSWMGCSAMTTEPSIGVSAADNVLDTATYKYKFCWEYDSYQLANAAGFVSAASEVGVSAIQIYGMETAPINATHLDIYRTEGGGSVYNYHSRHTVGTASGWLSASPYVDILADSSLNTAKTAPTDNGMPPITKYMVNHKERIFLAGYSTSKSNIYFSDITGIVSYPDIFPVANYIPISPDDGDIITGLAIDPTGYLCIFKKNSIRKIFTDGDPASWGVSEPFTKLGCWAPETIRETPYGIIYLAKDGWRVFDGQSSNFIGGNDRVSKIVKDEIMLTRFDKCVGHYHNNLAYLSYADRTTNVTHNNRVLIYDFLSDNFIIDRNKNIDSFCTFSGGDDWGEIYYGDSVYGFVYQEDVTIAGVTYDRLSQFRPGGSLSACFIWNTETDPYLELGGHYTFDRMAGSCFNDYGSATTPSYWNGFPTNYAVSGYYKSPALGINAKGFNYAFWNQTLGDYGYVSVQFRTSSTSAGLSAAWSSVYQNPAGSDISGLTANDWAQFMITLSSTSLSATPRIHSLGGYIFKFTYRVTGALTEEIIDADWRGGYMQLTSEGNYSRLKRFEIDHEGTDGQLSCIWDMDNNSVSGIHCINLNTYPKNYHTSFPLTAFGRRLRIELKYENIEDLTIKAINILHSVQPERY